MLLWKNHPKIVKEWFEINKIDTLDWPANNPDLNPIENLWSWLDKQIAKDEPVSVDNLVEIVGKHMKNVPIDMVKNLIQSMPQRVQDCLKNQGGLTRY